MSLSSIAAVIAHLIPYACYSSRNDIKSLMTRVRNGTRNKKRFISEIIEDDKEEDNESTPRVREKTAKPRKRMTKKRL